MGSLSCAHCEQAVNSREQLRFDSGGWLRIILLMPNQASPEIAVPSPHNWRTTDEDEINRRRARARTEEFRISNNDPRHPIFSNFRVRSGSGLTYSVEVRDVRQRQFACECVDFRINGLGTCKHVEAVLLQLGARFKRLFRAAEQNGALRLDVAQVHPHKRRRWRNVAARHKELFHRAVAVLGPEFFGEVLLDYGDTGGPLWEALEECRVTAPEAAGSPFPPIDCDDDDKQRANWPTACRNRPGSLR